MANTKKYVSLDKLSLYNEKIQKVITDADAVALKAAKDYADGLAVNYDASGSANTALESAKSYTDGQITTVNGTIAGVKTTAEQGVTDAAAAKAAADAAQGEVDALEGYVGTFTHDTAKTVVEYINAKTDGIATSGNLEALGTRVTTVEGKVATIEGDYLKAADKTELEGDIADVQAAVDAEAVRADAAEKANAAAIKAISDDYLKAADKTELQGNINTVSAAVERLTNGVSADEVDGVNDLIQYVKDHGTEVTGMQEDIAQNASDIDAVEGRLDTAEGKISTLEGSVANKVEQTVYDAKVAELAGADTALGNRIATLEGKFGGADGSVEDQIADAKAEAISTAADDATSKANAAETNAKTYAKDYADGLNTAMNTRVEALEAVDHDHSNKTVLDGITAEKVTGWDNASAKVHEHSNLSVLEGITSAKVTAWDAAEGNAKTFAQGLNDAVAARVTTLETWHNNFTECSEDDINGLFA